MDEIETPDLTTRLRAHWQSNQGNWLLLHSAIVSLIGFYCIFANSFPEGGRTRPITRPATRISPQIVDLNFENPDRAAEDGEETVAESAPQQIDAKAEDSSGTPTSEEPVGDNAEAASKPVTVPN